MTGAYASVKKQGRTWGVFVAGRLHEGGFFTHGAADDAARAINECEHEWQEQPGEPPVDVCSKCGITRE